MGSRMNNAFVGTHKRDDDGDDRVGLGLRVLQRQVGESYYCPNNNYKSCFMPMPMPTPTPPYHSAHHHHHHLSPSSTPPSSSSSPRGCSTDGFDGGASCGGGGGGAIVCNSSNQQQQVPCTGDIYDVVGAASASAPASASASAAAVVLKSLHHHPFSAVDPSFPHNSSGEMAAATNGRQVAFTAAQWQELERQTTIYRYMMASIPVPPELLIPLSRNPSNVIKVGAGGGCLELGFGSNNGSDPEPWRCRRTDGKKWRCSRDVAPDQKYCERHSHKSRPRSRKPVELPNHPSSLNNDHHKSLSHSHSHSLLNNMPSPDHSTTTTTTTTTTKQQQQQQQPPPRQSPHFLNHSDAHLFTISPFDQSRCLEWFMKGENTTSTTLPFGSNSNPVPEWQQQFKTQGTKYGDNVNVNVNASPHHRLNLQAHHHLNHQQFTPTSLSSLGGDLTLNQAHNSQQTRSFIDAWSTAERSEVVAEMDAMGSKRPPLCSNDKLPISSLTLSMSGGNTGSNQEEGDDHESSSQMGAFGLRPQMSNPVSWMGSPPGGPLAEALCLGIATSQSTGASSYSKST